MSVNDVLRGIGNVLGLDNVIILVDSLTLDFGGIMGDLEAYGRL